MKFGLMFLLVTSFAGSAFAWSANCEQALPSQGSSISVSLDFSGTDGTAKVTSKALGNPDVVHEFQVSRKEAKNLSKNSFSSEGFLLDLSNNPITLSDGTTSFQATFSGDIDGHKVSDISLLCDVHMTDSLAD